MDQESESKKTAKDQLKYQRDELKAFDTRFGWSSVASIGLIIFISTNAFHEKPPTDWGGFWNRVVLLVATLTGFAAFFMSSANTILGMLSDFTPWAKKARNDMGTTGLLWTRNISECKTADDFVIAYQSQDDAAIERSRLEEIWRTATVLEDRERALLSARFWILILGGAAMIVGLEVLIIKGNITIPGAH